MFGGKIKSPYIISGGLALLLVAWFVYGTVINPPQPPQAPQTARDKEQIVPIVEIANIDAADYSAFIDLHGQSEPLREVLVKAETAGRVVAAPIAEGQIVKKGALLCRQDVDARQAMLDQAEAQLRARELDYKAAQTLVDKGFRSPVQALGAAAALDGAKAALRAAEIELGNINIRAPFSGVFERQIAEAGDFLAPGQPCGQLVDLDPLLVVGEVPETKLGDLIIGGPATVRLATGENVDGTIRLIAAKANPATRTFRTEISIPNPAHRLKAGVTATIKIPTGRILAHRIPAGVITLDEVGRLGVRHLGSDDRVLFSAVQTLEETADGIWVTGLAGRVRLITRGQDYVAEGTRVRTQFSSESEDGNEPGRYPGAGG